MTSGEPQPARRHRRRTVRLRVEYEVAGLSSRGYATTLGGGGLFIETDAPLPRETPLVASFRLLEHTEPHRVPGRVVWSHAPAAEGGIGVAAGMGVEFTDGAAAARVAKELETLP